MRHVEAKYLWIQGLVARGRIRVDKVARKDNPADVLTKYNGAAEMREALAKVGVQVGRKKEKTKRRWADLEDEEDVGNEDEVEEGLRGYA
jgi:hypothetical protein